MWYKVNWFTVYWPLRYDYWLYHNVFILLFYSMARKKRPRKIGNHTEENMAAALELIKTGEKIRKAAKLRGIPYPTLRRYYLKTTNAVGQNVKLIPNYIVNQIFNSDQEDTLLKYLKDCAFSFMA